MSFDFAVVAYNYEFKSGFAVFVHYLFDFATESEAVYAVRRHFYFGFFAVNP